jgi:hypothetical protein
MVRKNFRVRKLKGRVLHDRHVQNEDMTNGFILCEVDEDTGLKER